MKRNFKRTDRIGEMLQRELSQIIQYKLKDPRLPSIVTISGVQVTPDLGHAKVYFTVLNDSNEQVKTILNAAADYLRGLLAKSIKLSRTPELYFVYDQSIEYGKNLSRLIDKANEFPESD